MHKRTRSRQDDRTGTRRGSSRPLSRRRPAAGLMNHRPTQYKVLAALVMACFARPDAVFANPVNGTVAAGSASFATQGSTLTVTNTPGTVINWGSFSIGSGETTRFNQQS